MSYERHDSELDYYPCTYGASRVPFRGPQVGLEQPYVAVLGGSEVYGCYIEDPFTDRLSEMTGRRVLNLGVRNGSLDVYAQDEALMKVIAGAETTVIQVMGGANISNRFYSVHRRRNDRFLRHSILMETLFQEVDFSDFSFTRHMLCTLKAASEEKFAMVTRELQEAWVARMRLLLSRIPGTKILLWIENAEEGDLGPEPLFVTVDMMQKLEPMIDKLVHCDVTDDQRDGQLRHMIYPEMEVAAARLSLSNESHERIARVLARAVGRRDGRRLTA
ncbi:DUF6473 family protein [Jannaschia sp. M317]|uniref:DUF6473 family protein n=1 Tax=Jannaschia sp. M317 TaxID=2867011 RepID=UPI0021A5723A|nr:DUF6473 family protein [Jannaschia sp. M317]UWQ17371.1 DUF6473 family protein [Jannaschia sp. M317]